MSKKKKVAKTKSTKPKKAVAPKVAKPVKAKKDAKPKSETKLSKVVDLMKRPSGATMQELIDATEWQKHTVRATISATISKKMGLTVEATTGDDKTRTYKIVS